MWTTIPSAPSAKASQDPGKGSSSKESVLPAATHLFYIVSCFCTSFNEHYIQLFGFPFSFLNGHLSGEENTELGGKKTQDPNLDKYLNN